MHNPILINNAIKNIDSIISIQLIIFLDGWRPLYRADGGDV